MNVLIKRVRTAILVRNRQGYYRMVYFNPMPAEKAIALLSEYGISADEVVNVETLDIYETLKLNDGQIVPMLLAAFDTSPFVLGNMSGVSHRSADEWIKSTLQSMLPRDTILGPLSQNLKNEIYTLINETHSIL